MSLVSLPVPALAQDVEPARKLSLRPLEESEPAPVEAPPSRVTAEQRPFAYLLDPSTPSRGAASFEYGLGLSSGTAADRPLPAVLVAPSSTGNLGGAQHSLSFGYGVTDRFAPFVTARLGTGDESQVGGAAGARVQLTSPDGPFRLTLAGALLREGSGAFGSYLRLAASYDVGRLRVASNVHAERAFRSGRDPVDVMVMAGASYRALDVLRVGVEYVGQDLEEAFEGSPEAEGGARHYAGPTLALDLGEGRVQLVGGPAFDLSQHTPRPLGRAAMMVTFLARERLKRVGQNAIEVAAAVAASRCRCRCRGRQSSPWPPVVAVAAAVAVNAHGTCAVSEWFHEVLARRRSRRGISCGQDWRPRPRQRPRRRLAATATTGGHGSGSGSDGADRVLPHPLKPPAGGGQAW